MIVEQHYLSCLAQASYLLVDEASGQAMVVDPRRDVQVYLDRAAELGARIEHVLLTHFHADFLAGHLELQRQTGSRIYLGRQAGPDYDHVALSDGQELELGPQLRLKILETPGHTPESISVLVFDRQKSEDQPYAVLTGDTLFIGDVGRPDLMASVGMTSEELARLLYRSTRDKLLTLPDETILYPGHGAGSACGKNLSSETSCTIGRQRETNYALQEMDVDTFVSLVTAGQPQAPAYFARAAGLNRKQRELLDEAMAESVRGLGLEEFLARQNEGAQVLDTRHQDDFAKGHLPGSIHVGLDGKFATWAGSVLDLERPILVVAEPGREREAALRLGRIGLDRMVGYLEGGPQAEAFTAQVEGIDADHAAASRDAEQPLVVDVRGPGEYEGGHLEDALNLPLPQLRERMEELPRDRKLWIHCQTGYRSMTACSLLQKAGYTQVVDLNGGYEGWAEAGHPTQVPSPA